MRFFTKGPGLYIRPPDQLWLPASASKTTPSNSDQSNREHSKKKTSKLESTVIGASVGGSLAFISILVLLVLCYRRNLRLRRKTLEKEDPGIHQEQSTYSGGEKYSNLEVGSPATPNKGTNGNPTGLEEYADLECGNLVAPVVVETCLRKTGDPDPSAPEAQEESVIPATTMIDSGLVPCGNSLDLPQPVTLLESPLAMEEQHSTLEPIDYSPEPFSTIQRDSSFTVHLNTQSTYTEPMDPESEIRRLEEEVQRTKERRELLERKEALRQRISELRASSNGARGPSWS